MNGADIAWADDIAKQQGVRIISPDRPGIGESSMQRNRTILDWAHDVDELTTQLKITSFDVMGWSMGGQYALACAYALPKKISRVSLIASCVDLSSHASASELNAADSKLSKLSNRAPWAAQLLFAGMRTSLKYRPQQYLQRVGKDLNVSDRQALQVESTIYATSMHQALRQTRGMVEEYRTFVRPWGFKPQAIKTPVAIWQGTADNLVPVSWAKQLANDLQKSGLHLVDDAGHFVLQSQSANILATDH